MKLVKLLLISLISVAGIASTMVGISFIIFCCTAFGAEPPDHNLRITGPLYGILAITSGLLLCFIVTLDKDYLRRLLCVDGLVFIVIGFILIMYFGFYLYPESIPLTVRIVGTLCGTLSIADGLLLELNVIFGNMQYSIKRIFIVMLSPFLSLGIGILLYKMEALLNSMDHHFREMFILGFIPILVGIPLILPSWGPKSTNHADTLNSVQRS